MAEADQHAVPVAATSGSALGPWRDPVTAYARWVVAGAEVAGPHVRDSCRRHLNDLETAVVRGLYWDLDAALDAIGFFPTVLRLNGGQFEGQPFCLHWSQQFIVGCLFGWKRADGTRRFRRAYLEIAKGNGKSPMLAGIGMYGLVADGEPRAEIYAGASKKDQAMVLFRDAVAMYEQSPELNEALTKSGGEPVWNLAYRRNGSFFRPISNDKGPKKGQSGPRPHMALCDEVHEHPDGIMIEMLERGFKFRRQPMLIMATNSGTDRQSVCWAEHQYAVKVAAGEVEDDSAFSYVCAVDKDDDPLNDPSCWKKVNPLLGTILTEEYLAEQAKQARQIAGKANNIKRLHFCIWTDADTAWLESEAWKKIEDPGLDLADFVGRRAWLGLDLASNRDMTGKSLLVEDGTNEEGERCYALFVIGYFPADGIAARALKDQAPYDEWAEAGYLQTTPGKTTRLDYIAADVVEDTQTFDVEWIAYDRWLWRRFEEELDALGIDVDDFQLIEHPQGFTRRADSDLSMPESIDAFEKLILDGRIRVQVSPPLRAAVSSAVLDESPAGLRRFSKLKATARIDLAVSSTFAVGAAECGPEPDDNEIEYTPGQMFGQTAGQGGNADGRGRSVQ